MPLKKWTLPKKYLEQDIDCIKEAVQLSASMVSNLIQFWI